MSTQRRNRFILLALGAAIAAAALGACGGDTGRRAESTDSAARAAAPMAPMEEAEMYFADDASFSLDVAVRDSVDGGGSQGAEPPAQAGNREIITRGSASVVAADPLEAAGGFVENRTETQATDRSSASAWLVVRVPSSAMTGFMAGLDQFGEVRSVDVGRQDVTQQGADLDARIEALQTSVRRLTELMEQSGSVEDLLSAERELTWRQSDLDSLRAQRSTLTDQVQMSTLEVNIWTEREAGPAPRTGFLGGLQNGWDSLTGFGRGLLVAIGAALPWLGVGAVVIVGTALVVRRRLRHRAAAGTDVPVDADGVTAQDSADEGHTEPSE